MARFNGQTSPGVYFTERDLTQVVEQPAVGITVGGVLGETVWGPAFEPILVRNKDEFAVRFGPRSNEKFTDTDLPKYEAAYIANSFLEQANQLWVVRVLGLSGYIDLGGDFIITSQAAMDTLTSTVTTFPGGVTSVVTIGATYGDITADASTAVYQTGNALSTASVPTPLYGVGGNNPTFPDFTYIIGPTSGWFELTDSSVDIISDTTWSGTGITYFYTSYTGGTYNYNTYTTTVTGDTINTNINPLYPLVTQGYFVPTNTPVRSLNTYSVTGSVYNFVSSLGNSYTYNRTDNVIVSGTPYAEYENMVLAVLRSRGNYTTQGNIQTSDYLVQPVTAITASGNLNNLTLTVSRSDKTGTTIYNTSLDKNSSKFITRVLTRNPINDFSDSNEPEIYVSEIYPELIKKLITDGKINGVNTGTLTRNTNLGNWTDQFQTPITPFIVSELKGNKIFKLFRFVSIPDGTNANTIFKISIRNINFETREFDVIIRDYNDTDNSPVVLETFSRLTLDPTSPGYILKRIGDANEYGTQSNYVYVEMAENAPVDAIPAGFEGYSVKNYGNNILPPKMMYRTQYFTENEKIRRVYLGVTQDAFDSDDFTYAGGGLDSDRYMYNNETISSVPSYTGEIGNKGFHMDRAVSGTSYSGSFETTIYPFSNENELIGTDLESPFNRKFTLVFAGGFDGWDIYRKNRTNTDRYRKGQLRYNNSFPSFDNISFTEETTDYYAYLEGINLFNNPEAINANIFATGGIDMSNHNSLVNEAIDMIEQFRADMLYIANVPNVPNSESYSQEISDIVDAAGIDSSYVATYAPWIQISDPDSGNVQLYVPPTGEVMRALAETDNRFYPWFATGGLTRGVLPNAIRPRTILRQQDRDLMYDNRINPILRTNNNTTIWGQKTMQVRESYLTQLSVRRMLLYVQRACVLASRQILFEPNDETEFNNIFRKIVEPILQTVKEERGLQSYFIKTDGLNNAQTRQRRQFYAQIFLTPIGAVEQIILDFNLTPEGFTLTEA